MRTKRLIALILVLCAVLCACAPRTDAPAEVIESATPLALPLAVEPLYSLQAVELPEGCNLVSNLRVFGEKAYFIAHFIENSAIYSMKTDGSGLSPLPDYVANSGTRAIALAVDNDGALIILETNTYKPRIAGEVARYFIRKLNSSGAVEAEFDISQMVDYPNFYDRIDKIEVDSDGNIYIWDLSLLQIFNSEGTRIFAYDPGTKVWLNTLVKMADGSVSAVGLEAAATIAGDLELRLMSPVFGSNELTVFAKRPENIQLLSPGNNGFDYYSSDYQSATAIKLPGTQRTLINWATYGIANRLTSFTALENGEIICAARRDTALGGWSSPNYYELFEGDSMAELMILTPQGTEAAPEKEKIILRLASFGSFLYQNLVYEFNAANPDFEIVVTEYDAGIDTVTFQIDPEAILKFNTALISGSVPDIIVASGAVSMNAYISKGIFADLYTFIDADPEIGRDAFVTSILGAYESGGRLYRLPVSFGINTVVASKASIGDRNSWTLDEVLSLEKETGIVSLPNKTSGEVLEFLLRQNLGRFINWQNGTCNFTGAEFIAILEYVKNFPPELREINPVPGSVLVRDGEALADLVTLVSYESYIEHLRAYGNEITYIGFPNSGGSGNVFVSTNTVSISEKSKNKAAAWQFVRKLFAEEFQLRNAQSVWPNFPVNQGALGKLAEKELSKEKAQITQNEIDFVNQLIASAESTGQLEYEPFGIIKEEAAPFFAGQKSAEEAAGIIQSRVAIYVSERS
jgi:ABC-type glycerol-3-phosphate transport system substrate-binding protein